MKKQLTYKDDKSDKFWSIETNGNSFTVTYGKAGTSGASQTKTFKSEYECENEAEKLVKEKMKKGYGHGEKKIDSKFTNEEESAALKELKAEGEFDRIVEKGEAMLERANDRQPFLAIIQNACKAILEGIEDGEHAEDFLDYLGMTKKECKAIYSKKLKMTIKELKYYPETTLLQTKANDEEGEEPIEVKSSDLFREAITNNDLKKLDDLIQRNEIKSEIASFIEYAILNGDISTLNYLLANHTKVEDDFLFKAVNYAKLDGLELLLSKGGNPDAKDYTGTCLLIAASFYGDASKQRSGAIISSSVRLVAIKILVKYGADINQIDDTGQSLLFHAIKLGDMEVVKFVLDNKGLNIHLKDNSGDSALMQAAESGNKDIVEKLLVAGCDLRETNKNLLSPIVYAVLSGNLEIVKLMVDKGAKLDQEDKSGSSILFYAKGSSVIQYLLDTGMDINARNKSGMTPLVNMICKFRKVEDIEFLLSKGADFNIEVRIGSDNYSALRYAKEAKRKDVVKILQKAGAK